MYCYEIPKTHPSTPEPPNPRPNIGQSDGDMLILATFPARYPRQQAAQDIEGYVVIGLTVNATGQVEDPYVLQSMPEGAFDQAATDAISKYKYKPRIIDGIPTSVYNVKYKMIFELED